MKSVQQKIQLLSIRIRIAQEMINRLKQIDVSKFNSEQIVVFDRQWENIKTGGVWCLFTKVAEEKLMYTKNDCGKFILEGASTRELFEKLEERGEVFLVGEISRQVLS